MFFLNIELYTTLLLMLNVACCVSFLVTDVSPFVLSVFFLHNKEYFDVIIVHSIFFNVYPLLEVVESNMNARSTYLQ